MYKRQSYEFLIPEGVSGIISVKFERLSDSSVANLEIPLIVDRKDSALEYQIPTWVKNNAGWWAEGQIDDNSFVKGIEYLVKVGLIQVT